jgi:octaprenyl-diphosphate synthase
MQRAEATQAQLIRDAIETGAVDQLGRIVEIVKQTGALAATHAAAAAEAQRAIDAIACLPPGPYVDALVALAKSLLDRRN